MYNNDFHNEESEKKRDQEVVRLLLSDYLKLIIMTLRSTVIFLTWAYLILVGFILVGPKGPIGPIFLEAPVNIIAGGLGIALGIYHLIDQIRNIRRTAA